MTAPHVTEEPTTDRWSALGGVLLSALYLWVVLWLLLAVLVPTIGLGWRPVVITSGSMAPLIRPGDVVLSAEAAVVEPGQVITYEDPARDGSLTTHRIVSVDDDGGIRTQGDANPTPDSTVVPPENVLGRGRLLVPLVGLPLLWLSGGAVLFGLWVVVTAVSVAVVAGATGSGGPPPPTTRNGGGGVTGPLLRLADRARPGHVQQIVVRALARRARGPNGPQLPIRRWQRRSIRPGHAASALLPARLSGRVVVALAMLVAVAAATVGRSAATFSAAADSDGSSFAASAAFSTCPGSDSAVTPVQGDTHVSQDRPTTNYSTASELEVTSKTDRNQRVLLTVALPTIPDGCSLTSARLLLESQGAGTGRTLQVQRVDETFDPATVTWADQPSASGTLGSGPSQRNGPTPIDVLGPVRDLYALGNTGLQVRDSVEDETATNRVRFHSSESRPYPDPEGPRLEVTWGP